MTSVDPSAFINGMKETVAAMRALCSTIVGAPARHGHLPSAAMPNVAMSDLAAESQYAERFGEDWLGPVRDTRTGGGMTRRGPAITGIAMRICSQGSAGSSVRPPRRGARCS